MNGMEIALLIIGLIIFILSFLIPGKKDSKNSNEMKQISEEQIKDMVEKEVEQAKHHINEIVDETITYAMEKSERSMDRITNEKMLAVNEYSDTVLESIKKNHEEVVFLYDMLNDKQETLKVAVGEAAKVVSAVKDSVIDAEIAHQDFIKKKQRAKEETNLEYFDTEVTEAKKFNWEVTEPKNFNKEVTEPQNFNTEVKESESFDFGSKEEVDFIPINPKRVEVFIPPSIEKKQHNTTQEKTTRKSKSYSMQTAEAKQSPSEVDIQFASVNMESRNSNGRILELRKAGKSKMAIAKELGLGVGEVKLVIDLFDGM